MCAQYSFVKNRQKQDFLKDVQDARKTEDAVGEWLDSLNVYSLVRNVNAKGHDIECILNDKSILIEVKRDTWIDELIEENNHRKGTSNACVEIWSDFTAGNLGWIIYTDSKYIFYVGNKNIYVFHTSNLRQLIYNFVDIGESPNINPFFKIDTENLKIAITSAPRNGNWKVRNVTIGLNILKENKCLIKTFDREKSGFNKIAKRYNNV